MVTVAEYINQLAACLTRRSPPHRIPRPSSRTPSKPPKTLEDTWVPTDMDVGFAPRPRTVILDNKWLKELTEAFLHEYGEKEISPNLLDRQLRIPESDEQTALVKQYWVHEHEITNAFRGPCLGSSPQRTIPQRGG